VNTLDRLAEAWLRLAARRWPDDLRAEQHQEWLAELAELRRDSDRGPLARSLAQLRFAASLACSPPVEDEGGVPQGWREELPKLGNAVRPLFIFAFAAVFCGVLARGTSVLGETVLEMVRGYPSGVGPSFHPGRIDWGTHLAQFAALVVAAGFAILIGRWLGHRLPFPWAHRTRLGAAGSAVVAPFGLLLGIALMSLVQIMPELGYALPPTIPAAAVFAVGMAWLGWRVTGHRHAGRKVRARLTAAVGSLVLLDAVGIVAAVITSVKDDIPLWTGPAWFPLSLLDPNGSGFEFGMREQGFVASHAVVGAAASSTRVLTVAAVLLWAYNRNVREREARISLPTHVPLPRTARLGGGVAAVALLIWGYAAAAVTPALTAEVDSVGEFHIWAQEIRLGALVAAVLGLSLVLAGRAAVVVPGLLAFAGLMTVDSIVDSRDLAGPVVGVAIVLIGLAVLLVAFAAGRFLGGGRVDGVAARRTAAGVAILGALSGPALFFQAPESDLPSLPRGLAVVTGIDVFLLLLAACWAAFAVRTPLRPRWAAVTVTAVIAGGLGALGFFTLTGLLVLKAGGFAQLPVGAVLLLVMGWPRRSVWKWLLIFASSVLLAIPMVYLDLMVSVGVAGVLFGVAGYTFPADGLPFFSGAVLVGWALAGLLSLLIARELPPSPSPALAPSPTPSGPDQGYEPSLAAL
jgi:hypothetical protein